MKDTIIAHNKAYLHQFYITPCIIEPLSSFLGVDSRTSFGNKIISDKVNFNNCNRSKSKYNITKD